MNVGELGQEGVEGASSQGSCASRVCLVAVSVHSKYKAFLPLLLLDLELKTEQYYFISLYEWREKVYPFLGIKGF